MRSWGCSQIGHEEEEGSWREWDHMAAQWDEKQQFGGDLGTKKDGRKLLAVGGYAKKYQSYWQRNACHKE